MNSQQVPMVVPELLLARAAESPAAPACYHRAKDGLWIPTTWNELWENVRTVAAAFQDLGLLPGDRLAIWAHTCEQWQVAEMAGLMVGASILGIGPHVALEQAERILKQSNASALIVDPREDLQELAARVRGRLRFVIILGDAGGHEQRLSWHTWADIARGAVPSDPSRFPKVTPDDPAFFLYTSGTTGEAKSIAFSHHQIMVACRALYQAFPELGPQDAMMAWLPMSHLFQPMMNLVAIAKGARTYFVENAQEILPSIQGARPSVFIAVPRFYEKLHEGILGKIAEMPRLLRRVAEAAIRTGDARARCERAGRRAPWGLRLRHRLLDRLVLRRIRQVMGGNIRFMITGTAPTPLWLLEFFHAVGLLVLEGYAFSENTVPVAANRPRRYRFGSVGMPFPENEIRFSEDREILVRGPGLCRRDSNEGTELDCFTADGSYRTGDFGYLDTDGFLFLTGRRSDIIKTSTGRRIAPAKIEAVYSRCPYLDHVVVIGNGRKHLVGLVTVRAAALKRAIEGKGLNIDQPCNMPANSGVIHKFLRQELEFYGRTLPEHERILNFTVLSQPLSMSKGELTPTLKVRRDRVAAIYADIIDRLYAETETRREIGVCPLLGVVVGGGDSCAEVVVK